MLNTKITQEIGFKDSYFYNYFINDPIGFIDVGARGGSHSLVEPLHTHVSFLGFEPDLEECDQLNQDAALKEYWNQFKVLPNALSNDYSQRTLNILSAATNSSLLEPNSTFVDRYKMAQKWTITKKFPVATVPLDHVMFDLNLGFEYSGEIIKLDTQGTEYEIIEGARRLLSEKTVCVVTEVEFFSIYQGQKLFSDVEVYLRELGFSFYGFLTMHTRSQKTLNKKTNLGKERLFYADAVFFKDPLSTPVTLNERSLNVLLFSAILTGFYDFAIELATSPLLKLPESELNLVCGLIETVSYVSPEATEQQLQALVKNVSSSQASTNVLVGKFIDKIAFPDFEDC